MSSLLCLACLFHLENIRHLDLSSSEQSARWTGAPESNHVDFTRGKTHLQMFRMCVCARPSYVLSPCAFLRPTTTTISLWMRFTPSKSARELRKRVDFAIFRVSFVSQLCHYLATSSALTVGRFVRLRRQSIRNAEMQRKTNGSEPKLLLNTLHVHPVGITWLVVRTLCSQFHLLPEVSSASVFGTFFAANICSSLQHHFFAFHYVSSVLRSHRPTTFNQI